MNNAPVNKSLELLEKIIFMSLVIQLKGRSFNRKIYLFVLLALSVANLLESPLKLRNTGTGYGVHVAAVTALEEVVSNTCNHCSVISAKLEWREDAVEVSAFCQHCAKSGISRNTAATNYSFKSCVVCGFQ